MKKTSISPEIKNIIEQNPITIATITPQGMPNIIGVASVKVINDNQILVTDNFMNQTIKDIKNSPHVAVLGWDKKMTGYKLLGDAKYFDSGEYLMKVKALKENQNMPVKGALLITVRRIIKSA